MKKKIRAVSILVIIFILVLLYFRPLPLSALASENQTILVSHVEFAIEDGEPSIENENYNNITEQQKKELLDLFDGFSYYRTLGTLFSDGTLTDLGNRMVHIYVYEGSRTAQENNSEKNVLVNEVTISESGSMSVNGKTYKLFQTAVFLEELAGIVGE